MSLVALKDRFLALPWVYDTLRPLVVGGIDLRVLGSFCAVGEKDRVFDLGCGTAQLLPFLSFERYLGVDLDKQALAKALQRKSSTVQFLEGDSWDEAAAAMSPNVALMIGVVHHLSDRDFRRIVDRILSANPRLERLVTIDVTYYPGALINNLLSRLDRGKYVRNPAQYEDLFRSANLQVTGRSDLPTQMRYVKYVGYQLRPEREI